MNFTVFDFLKLALGRYDSQTLKGFGRLPIGLAENRHGCTSKNLSRALSLSKTIEVSQEV